MENLVVEKLFSSIYKNKKVFLTGHTGFKGSWLVFWLKQLGADVLGYSKDFPSYPNHYQLLELDIKSVIGDIRDLEFLTKNMADFQPDIVFHLAAQPLVRYSYLHTIETFHSNVIGTANVLEAIKNTGTIKAVVNITSDKAYENIEQDIAYVETDRMGGYDPYSASKGCAELVANCYRRSFFHDNQYGKSFTTLLASARAGNVIGGGDWAQDRLIPDIVKASVSKIPVLIRNPSATRPWQHVLEPLSGYLLLGQMLLEGRKEFADGWNFGPRNNSTLSVNEVLLQMKNVWGNFQYDTDQTHEQFHEASLLKLDCAKANNKLRWFPIWDMETSIEKTADWYKNYYDENFLNTRKDLIDYVNDAKMQKNIWAL